MDHYELTRPSSLRHLAQVRGPAGAVIYREPLADEEIGPMLERSVWARADRAYRRQVAMPPLRSQEDLDRRVSVIPYVMLSAAITCILVALAIAHAGHI